MARPILTCRGTKGVVQSGGRVLRHALGLAVRTRAKKTAKSATLLRALENAVRQLLRSKNVKELRLMSFCGKASQSVAVDETKSETGL